MNVNDEIAALNETYFDSMKIERLTDVKDGHVTKQQYEVVADNVLCGYSQAARGELPVIVNDEMVNISKNENKVYCSPLVDIQKGDRLTIDHYIDDSHGVLVTGYAKTPTPYPNHLAVEVTEKI